MDREGLTRGVALFNSGHFFEAHEVLEDVWRAAPEAERRFLQGLIQLAVAFHHRSTGNLVGAASLMQRGARNLSLCSEDFGGIRLSQLLEAIAAWQRTLLEGTPPPAMPQIEFVEC
jgi:uncharacterized protein